MTAALDYTSFLGRKLHEGAEHGFDPVWMPEGLFPFQADLITWALRKGRAAIFADCGMGKTRMQLTVADNVARVTGRRVLVLTPLAVAFQTVKEGAAIDLEVTHRRQGIQPGDRLVVTNYERLHHFRPEDFAAVVCDESSILKGFDGATRAAVTDFMRKVPYRLLCTATAAPNDYIELGTSSEALGEMGAIDMVNRFFKKTEKTFTRNKEYRAGLYRFRGHAEANFWRWVCSWARALRRPSDMGYPDGDFRLPPLTVNIHAVEARTVRPGYLFNVAAVGLNEHREDLRRTLDERCERMAERLNAHDRPVIAWCNLNDEGTRLARLIDGAVEVAGSDPEEAKEEKLLAFAAGQVRALVTKPKIAGFGMNYQHCAHIGLFPTYSHEQYYQIVRRCWRFGQTSPVTVDVVTSDGQADVLESLRRKADQADQMFDKLVELMWNELRVRREDAYTRQVEVPSWL